MDVSTTPDGRDIEYFEVGAVDGLPVVYLHGTPATGGSVVFYEQAAIRNGVRLVGVSRPGYGHSTTTPPGLLSVGRDIGDLATGLGIGEFAVLGTSGGGPFALAAAAAIPERIRRVVVAAGPGPISLIAPEHLELDDERALEILAAGDVDGAVALVTAEARRDFADLRQRSGEEFEQALTGIAPPGEHYFDNRPAEHAIFAADFRRAIERYDGFVRDNLSWCGSWDFDLAAVVAPVHLLYGAADTMAPVVHGEWLADHLPVATLTVVPEAGHGDICFGSAEEIFALVKQAPHEPDEAPGRG